MDNLLNQVQSLLPTDNGTWSVYVCNLAKNTEGAINDQQMQAASLIKLYIMGAVYEIMTVFPPNTAKMPWTMR